MKEPISASCATHQTPPQSCTPSPLELLRSKSLAAHKALENTAVARGLMSPWLTKEDYIEILKVWSSIWQPLEQAIIEYAPRHIAPEFVPPLRASKIHLDLAILGVKDCHTLPQWELPEQLTRANAWYGMAYVVKGSSLGAQIIAQHLQATLNIGSETGGAFFSAHNNSIAWPLWIKWLNSELEQNDRLGETIAATQSTFTLLTRIFSRKVSIHD